MVSDVMNGVFVTPLKQIYHPKGNIFHAMKCLDIGYNGFGEAYFSTIKKGQIKAWKKHLSMTLNLVCISGSIHFVLYDGRRNSKSFGKIMEVILSPSSVDNYNRLTIPPGIWMGFVGISDEHNILLNLADILHDPTEQINISIEESDIEFDWNRIIFEK